ncbi:hypothetical protein BC829DRAFT_398963 [Chytridium lagenaria]|nr:hypothetical protein BC829DRAFT_398963 [Chytridium lagenaria]
METDSTEDRVFQCGFLTTFMLFTTSYSLRFRDLLVFAAWVVLTFMCALLLIGMYNGAGEMELRRHFVLKEVLFPAESGGRSGDGESVS